MSKKQWGNATWFMFHTLAEKIKPEHPEEIRALLSYITNICVNLPCPYCSQHARNNIAQCRPNMVKTKDDLKIFVWQLHNRVNAQLRKPIVSYEECTRKYKFARTLHIINYFKHYMSISRSGLKMMVATRNKATHVNNLLRYLQNILHKFDQ